MCFCWKTMTLLEASMTKTPFAIVALMVTAMGTAAVADAAEIKVLSALAFKPSLSELAGEFERTSGHKLTFAYGSAGAIRDRIQGGEVADVALSSKPMIEALIASGKIPTGTTVSLAQSLVAVAIRAGSPKPDISSVDAFRRAMLSVKSIAYPDPTKGFLSGIHMADVFARLGIIDQMKAKAKLMPGREGCELVAKGEIEVAITQVTEILAIPGVEVAGVLPKELQNTTDFAFSAGVTTNARGPDAARALLRFLTSPAAMKVIKANGMEPG
jgi:molybdate transport system substrate-binding protein